MQASPDALACLPGGCHGLDRCGRCARRCLRRARPAQNYPTKPIHILVPYAPGGITDIASRIVGAKLTEAWGQQVVVENRPGGNAFIAMTAGRQGRARRLHAGHGDGRRLSRSLRRCSRTSPYDMQRDFVPIATVSDAPMVLAAHANAPFKSVAEVIAGAKAQPGRISVAHAGQRQRQSDRAGMDGVQYRHQVPAHSLQGRRAGRRPRSPAATFRSACWRAPRSRPHVK